MSSQNLIYVTFSHSDENFAIKIPFLKKNRRGKFVKSRKVSNTLPDRVEIRYSSALCHQCRVQFPVRDIYLGM